MTYRKFRVENQYFQDLSPSDKKVLKILQKVVEGVDVLYQKQLKDGFYPKDVTKSRKVL